MRGWILIHGTDKEEKDLMVIFFGLVFSVASPFLEIFLLTPSDTNYTFKVFVCHTLNA